MEKQAEVRPGLTPDTEQRLPPGEKAASGDRRTRQTVALDDDFAKRAAGTVSSRLS